VPRTGYASKYIGCLDPLCSNRLTRNASPYELLEAGLQFERQKPLPVVYKDVRLDSGYRLDFVLEDSLILELKAVNELIPIHEAQLLTFLKLTRLPLGLLVNFNVPA